MKTFPICIPLSIVLFLFLSFHAAAIVHYEPFDQDPLWDGLNNFSQIGMRSVVQDFGYRTTTNCNALPGEIGGTITPDARPAYCAKPLAALSLNDSFTASGKILVGQGGGNTLLGFFNPATANEWRMANSIVFRLYGRSNIFQAHVEYGTSLWRAGAGMFPADFTSGMVYDWSLTYTPIGADDGEIVAVLDGQTATSTLGPGHRSDGATLTHFGLINVLKHPDDTGTIWIDEVVINGVPEDFTTDPGWDTFQTQASYLSEDTRPRFAFGYSATQFTGGQIPGEIGGRFFRGDCRYPETLAYYGAVVENLCLESRLEASGKVCLKRAVSDSSTLFGFFHSQRSVFVNPSQSQSLPAEFLGFAIEGPSAEGHYIYPCYRTSVDGAGRQFVTNEPYIYPNSQTGDWSLIYEPDANAGDGEIRLTYGGQTAVLPLLPGHKNMGAQFDRFGFVTPWVDGNGQLVYFDDLQYTYDIPTTAQFSANITEGVAPLQVSFQDESTSKYTITGWTWDFGDGSAPSNEQHPNHIYTQDGVYTVTLTITTSTDSGVCTKHWFINVGNSLPGTSLVALAFLIMIIAGSFFLYFFRWTTLPNLDS